MPALDAAACADLMDALTVISVRAARAIRDMGGPRDVHIKADQSPVTAADEAAQAVICDGLRLIAPALPVVAEENAEYGKPVTGEASWFLVDPLDGTREYIAGRDEYTINIALITNGTPVLGIITAPALGLIWRGIVGRGAERITLGSDFTTSQPHAIHTRPRRSGEFVVVVSRSHLEARTQAFVDNLPQAKRMLPSGSAIKFCRVAEGSADLYPRLATTCDWDVAAGHAIVDAAGGRVVAPDGTPIRYGTAELRIPGFLAWGNVTNGA